MAKLISAGPWLIAIAPAYFIYETLTTVYEVPIYIAIPIGLGIELTGIAAFHTATRFYSWNRAKRKPDPAAPTWIAMLLIIAYLASGLILTAIIKDDWNLALFFLLAGVGYAGIALNISQDQRERDADQDKARVRARRDERKEHSPERPPNKPHPFERSPELDELLETVLERSKEYFWTTGLSTFSHTNVQKWTGRKRTTAYAVLRYGEQTGVIQRVGRGKYICRNGASKDD